MYGTNRTFQTLEKKRYFQISHQNGRTTEEKFFQESRPYRTRDRLTPYTITAKSCSPAETPSKYALCETVECQRPWIFRREKETKSRGETRTNGWFSVPKTSNLNKPVSTCSQHINLYDNYVLINVLLVGPELVFNGPVVCFVFWFKGDPLNDSFGRNVHLQTSSGGAS
jgi:hypothetical protein